jgi:O-antigen ligase
MSPRYRRQLLFTAGAAIFIGLLIVLSPIPFFKLQFNISQRLFASKEISARFYYWLIALEMIKNHLLLGVGYGNFNALFWEVVSNFQRQPENAFYRFILEEHIRGVSPGYVHNDYLQIAAESGLLGLGAWFGLWSVLLCQAWQTAKRAASKPRILLFSAALLAYFVGFAVDGLFNFPVQIPVSGFVFWLLLGMWVAFRDVAMKATESVAAGTSQ